MLGLIRILNQEWVKSSFNITRDYMSATLYQPVCKDSIKRINYKNLTSGTVESMITDCLGTDEVQILGMSPSPFLCFGTSDYKQKYSLSEAIKLMYNNSWEMDVPVRAIDIHPAIFPFGRKGFALIGESAYVDGPIIEDAIRLYVIPLIKNK